MRLATGKRERCTSQHEARKAAALLLGVVRPTEKGLSRTVGSGRSQQPPQPEEENKTTAGAAQPSGLNLEAFRLGDRTTGVGCGSDTEA